MNQSPEQFLERFKEYYAAYPSLGLSPDISRMNFSDLFFASMGPAIKKACKDMAALEGGAIANPNENRIQGFGLTEFLRGGSECDVVTRKADAKPHPAVRIALMWRHSGNDKATNNLAVLPYKDRLALFSRYLQRLVMESLDQEKDLNGKTVNQDIAVAELPFFVKGGITAGDFLLGFLPKKWQVLHQKWRESVTFTLTDVFLSVGVFRRAAYRPN